jgi:hypothetical protein
MTTVRVNGTETFRLSVVSVLSRTFSTLFGNLGVFSSLALLVALTLALTESVMRYLPKTEIFGALILGFLNLMLILLIQGAVVCGVFQVLRNRTTSAGAVLSCGMKRIFPLLGVSGRIGGRFALYTILIFVLMAFIGLPIVGRIMPRYIFGAFAAVIASFLGFILAAAILAFFLLCKWTVAIPACVVEQLNAEDSLKHSVWLTQGNRLKICGLVLLLGIFTGLSLRGAAFIAGPTPVAPLRGSLFTMLIHAVLSGIFSAIGSVMVAIVYFDLRMGKEGLSSIESLADIFD